MRLIDADALKASYIVTSTTTNSLCHLYVSIEDINNAPSIDIVRCKECKYAEVADPTDDQDGYICQFHRGSIWFSGSYCSWGERKESE